MINPQPGDFCCISISGSVGKLIEVGEWLNGDGFAPYEHAEVYIGQPDDNGVYGYTVSTYPNGHGKQPLPCVAASLPGALWSTGKISITDAQRQSVISWCEAHEEVKYSALDYFALVAHRSNIPAPDLKNFIADSGHMICSQYVDYSYMQAGIHLFNDGRWPGYVVPMDLAHLIEGLLWLVSDVRRCS